MLEALPETVDFFFETKQESDDQIWHMSSCEELPGCLLFSPKFEHVSGKHMETTVALWVKAKYGCIIHPQLGDATYNDEDELVVQTVHLLTKEQCH